MKNGKHKMKGGHMMSDSEMGSMMKYKAKKQKKGKKKVKKIKKRR